MIKRDRRLKLDNFELRTNLELATVIIGVIAAFATPLLLMASGL